MRILYVTRQYPPHGVGGIGTYVETLAKLMVAAGHEVTVLSASTQHNRSSEVIAGVWVERFPAVGPNWLWRPLEGLSWVVATRLRAALSGWAALRRLPGRFDVIEVPEWKAEGLLLHWCRKGSIVVHLHLPQELVRRWDGDPVGRWRGADVAERLERRTVRGADTVTATSKLSRSLPTGDLWLPEVAVAVVPPPVLLDEWRSCPSADVTDPVVLFVGHLERRKAPEVLLEALGLLAKEVPGLRGIFVGRAFEDPGGEPYDEVLRAGAARLGVDCEIRRPQAGAASMLELYSAARAVVVCSRYETLSMVALEGYSCGRPVVLTTAVGATEWVGEAVPDLVVRANDAPAVARALRPLLLDAHAARDAGERGRAALASACSVEAIVAERVRVYESVTPA